MELAIERITGKSASPNFMNQAMHDGVEREPDARTLFEAITGKRLPFVVALTILRLLTQVQALMD